MLNEVYSPTQEQFDRAWDILDAYRKATEDDRSGAVMFGDEMIDEASRKMATKFVTRGERAGLQPLAGLSRRARPASLGSAADAQKVNSAVPLVEDGVVPVHVDRAQRRPVVQGELEVGGGAADHQVAALGGRLILGPSLDVDPVRRRG